MNADTYKTTVNALLQTNFFHAEKALCKEESISKHIADGLQPFEVANKIAHAYGLRRIDMHGLPSMFHAADLTADDERRISERRQEKILADWTTIQS